MHSTLRAGLRVAGLMVMAIAIAHCGDNSNDNVTGPTRTPTPVGPTRTPTPTTTSGGVTPTVTITVTPGPVCPSAISFEADATTSILDAGWTGFGQGSKVIDKGKTTVQVTGCDHPTRPCGTCTLEGPIANPDAGHGTSNNQRCSGDTSIECTGDAACAAAAAGTCVFFFGAPLPLAAGGVATCVTNRVVGAITGTANIETGASASSVSLTSTVFSAGDQSEPCPVCENDATPEDGTRSGTCSAGPRAGMPCDVSGESSTFGKTSFDCPPEKLAQLAALPIKLATSTGTATRTLSPESPRCGARGFTTVSCMCDTCATAAAEPCGTNADCPAGRACGGKRCVGGTNAGAACSASSACPGGGFCSVPGAASKPNDCASGATCVPTASDSSRGECQPGPFNQFCAPHDDFRGCSTNTDCVFPGDTCTGGKLRPCYLDNGADGGSVTVAGRADPPVSGIAHPTLGALFCIGPTGGGAVDSAAGLPGLGRLKLIGTATEIP
jgi:hypothetical protein